MCEDKYFLYRNWYDESSGKIMNRCFRKVAPEGNCLVYLEDGSDEHIEES